PSIVAVRAVRVGEPDDRGIGAGPGEDAFSETLANVRADRHPCQVADLEDTAHARAFCMGAARQRTPARGRGLRLDREDAADDLLNVRVFGRTLALETCRVVLRNADPHTQLLERPRAPPRLGRFAFPMDCRCRKEATDYTCAVRSGAKGDSAGDELRKAGGRSRASFVLSTSRSAATL